MRTGMWPKARPSNLDKLDSLPCEKITEILAKGIDSVVATGISIDSKRSDLQSMYMPDNFLHVHLSGLTHF